LDARNLNDFFREPRPGGRDSLRANWERGGLEGLIGRWTNAVGRDDQLAYPVARISSLGAIADTTADIAVQTEEGDQHSIVAYLKTPWFAAAIAQEYCEKYDFPCRPRDIRDSALIVPPSLPLARLGLGAQAAGGFFLHGDPRDTSTAGAVDFSALFVSPMFP